MAVLLVLSIAGIFHRALHLHSSKHKSVFYRENTAPAAANKKYPQREIRIVCPFAGIFAERCIYRILTTDAKPSAEGACTLCRGAKEEGSATPSQQNRCKV